MILILAIACSLTLAADTYRDRTWLWGHDPASVRNTGFGETIGECHADVSEACTLLGMTNACVIRWQVCPQEPFEDYCRGLSGLKSFGWSAADGDTSIPFAEKSRRVVELARRFPKLTTVWLDGWFEVPSIRQPVSELLALRDVLQTLPQKPKLTVVFQAHEFGCDPKPVFDVCDQVSFWLWHADDIARADELFARCRTLAGPEKPILVAISLWDTVAHCPLDSKRMRTQLDFVDRKLACGEASGLVVHCSLFADCGFESVRLMRDWMRQNGDKIVGIHSRNNER